MAPASRRASAKSRLRTPPDAFTPSRPPTVHAPGARRRRASRRRARTRSRVLTKSAPADSASRQASTFSRIGEERRLEDDLHDRPERAARGADHRPDVELDRAVVSALEKSDGDHHVELHGAVLEGTPRLIRLAECRRRSVRERDHRADLRFTATENSARHSGPRRAPGTRPQSRTPRVSRQSRSMSARVVSGLSAVWSIRSASSAAVIILEL